MSNRCRNFGSAISHRHIKSSFVLAKFINRDGMSVSTYSSQIQYFFEHSIYASSQNLTHKLAYVKWYNWQVLQFIIILVLKTILITIFVISNYGKIVSS